VITISAVTENDLDVSTLELLYPSDPLSEGLRVNMASSLDGVIALDGRSQALSGALDKVIFRFLRSTASAIIVGASTAKIEHYGPVTVSERLLNHRVVVTGSTQAPPLYVIGSYRDGDLEWVEQLRDESNPTHIALLGMSPTQALGDGLINEAQSFDLRTPIPIVSHLLHTTSSPVLCEGGPRLLTTLLQGNVVQEICLSQAHLLAGGGKATLLGDLESLTISLSPAARIDAATHTFLRLIVTGRPDNQRSPQLT
jgi:riboflavin biosynthesis pyrimidine reductase